MPTKDDNMKSSFSPMAKRLLLERHLRSVSATQAEPTPSLTIPRRASNTPAVASFSQQRLWIVDQMYPDNAAYNITGVIYLRGSLHTKALERSLNELVRRHEALRTTFSFINDELVQRITPACSFSLPIIDLQPSTASASSMQEIQHRIQAEARQPFNLTAGPLFRAQLLKITDREHVLVLTMHHIISDGWSLGIFNQELATLYEAFTQQRPSPLPALPVQYADFAFWQRGRLQETILGEQLRYWKKQIADAPDILALPSDYSRPTVQTFQGATVTFTIAPQLAEKLQALCREENATLFMALLAIFQLLLARYTGQEDFLVGSPIAGRIYPETEKLIGFFVNTLVLRADLSGTPSFRTLLRRVRETCLNAYMYQELPFERLVEELQPQRDLSRNPLVQVCFALQNASTQPAKAGELAFEINEVKNGTTPFDMLLEFTETAEGLQGQCTYSSDLFKPQSIERLTTHYQHLAEESVEKPDQCIWDFSMLADDERQRLLVAWNTTQSPYPQQCIHQIFESQAKIAPDTIAVVCEQQVTYGLLDQLSNQLAHYLQKLGVGPETLVGLCVERSLEMVICLLGILKAGGAYVPFDPGYPHERLAYMIENAQVPLVLAHRRLLEYLPACQAQVLCLEEVLSAMTHEMTTPVRYTMSPDMLAYVMYTSGSTGKPKGTAIEHQSVVRLVKNTNYALFSKEHVFLQFAPIAFDAATFEIWGPLLNGGRLVVFPASISGLDELGAVLQRFHVTTLWLTAGLFHQMVEEQLQALKDVRQLLAGGDVLSVSHVQLLMRELPQCKLINGYGPTENTTFTTCYSVHQELPCATVPIGRPVANTRVYVLDRHLQLTPIGVPGELYIAGDGLARGYHQYPDLTSERFIPDPYSNSSGGRLYKTGDLVRYLPNGELEFLGRLDHQIKVRGFRVELSEIETTLNHHPDVHDCLVLPYDDQFGTKRLVAYIIGGGENGSIDRTKTLTQANLRTYLKKHLPEYMIPSAFMFLDAWPLTANGKIDRRALPPVVWHSPEASSNESAPRTSTESALLDIWKEVLGLNAVSIHDNFFDIGGHSLLTMRMFSRLRSILHIDLPMRILFEVPTIAELAHWIESSQQQTPVDGLRISSIQGKNPEQLLAQLEQLSDEEVEALLASITTTQDEEE